VIKIKKKKKIINSFFILILKFIRKEYLNKVNLFYL